ncbi:hypothetical protein DB30_00965 [Enhygromyxa salina]|uniref:Uncharacterized protein n=1 Tax=Enhygromyxa salina TaxID=215803 RepID=A0A0C2CYD4_9BACT|nr:hypothetical protein [Enhygromyxa salina]KIG12847.1 hypothetical protein DB30_00965 [Enhygromyxa salina]
MSEDRRRHCVFFTKHTEYHLRDAECVGVRDRSSGEWMLKHAALRLMALAIPELPDSEVWIGQRIHFWGRDTDVLTSPVVAVRRPSIDEVFDYVSQARAGMIFENPSSHIKSSLPSPAPAA